MEFLELFGVKPNELDHFTSAQIRSLADRADTRIAEHNRQAEQGN
jgi:hypothetical protein